jgi:hypothetical protein
LEDRIVDIHKTRTELVREAADKLNIVGTGQSLEAEYGEKIDGNVDPLFMQLARDGICEVVNDDFIPAEWFDAIAGLLANVSASIAGKGFDPQVKEYYETRLRRLTASRPSYNVMENEYF